MRFKVVYGNPVRYYLDGREVSREQYDAASPKGRLRELFAAGRAAKSQTTTCWPMRSDALACHPKQAAAITERNKRHGVTGVHYEKDGTCVIADRGARKALLALEGLHDNHGGYGDDHAGSSPLYREDSVPFADFPVELRHGDRPVFDRQVRL